MSLTVVTTIASFLLKEWQSLYNIFAKLFGWATNDQDQGQYEILEYEVNLELLDDQGHQAKFHKRIKVRFLQDNINLYQDSMWGESNWLTNYECYPGKRVEYMQDADRWTILIYLKETKNKGDIEEFHIQALGLDKFTTSEEWLQAEIRHQTKSLRLNVIFPESRHCQQAYIQQRKHNQSIRLDNNNIAILPDGRQIVNWDSKNVKPFQAYILSWKW